MCGIIGPIPARLLPSVPVAAERADGHEGGAPREHRPDRHRRRREHLGHAVAPQANDTPRVERRRDERLVERVPREAERHARRHRPRRARCSVATGVRRSHGRHADESARPRSASSPRSHIATGRRHHSSAAASVAAKNAPHTAIWARAKGRRIGSTETREGNRRAADPERPLRLLRTAGFGTDPSTADGTPGARVSAWRRRCGGGGRGRWRGGRRRASRRGRRGPARRWRRRCRGRARCARWAGRWSR